MIKMICPTCNSDDVKRDSLSNRFRFFCNACEDMFHQFDANTKEIIQFKTNLKEIETNENK